MYILILNSVQIKIKNEIISFFRWQQCMRVTSSNENMSWIVLMLIFLSINVDVLRSKEIDEDDDIDPFDDDDEPINYPIKSVMPERAVTQNGPKILPDNGSGQPSQSMFDISIIFSAPF